jgi:hypothetical protein
MQRWEYVVFYYEVTRFTELGAEGWELVSTIYHTEHSRIICFFKRPVIT